MGVVFLEKKRLSGDLEFVVRGFLNGCSFSFFM